MLGTYHKDTSLNAEKYFLSHSTDSQFSIVVNIMIRVICYIDTCFGCRGTFY
uniref:Uncharacterized protein n=1 Tax=Octopus bimaculoides TaxID=37653 RepID=A0A0L8GLU1_OCTBM